MCWLGVSVVEARNIREHEGCRMCWARRKNKCIVQKLCRDRTTGHRLQRPSPMRMLKILSWCDYHRQIGPEPRTPTPVQVSKAAAGRPCGPADPRNLAAWLQVQQRLVAGCFAIEQTMQSSSQVKTCVDACSARLPGCTTSSIARLPHKSWASSHQLQTVTAHPLRLPCLNVVYN